MFGVIKDKERLEIVKNFGVDRIVNVMKESLVDVVNEMIDGNGVNKGFDCFGFMLVVNEVLRLFRKKGIFV